MAFSVGLVTGVTLAASLSIAACHAERASDQPDGAGASAPPPSVEAPADTAPSGPTLLNPPPPQAPEAPLDDPLAVVARAQALAAAGDADRVRAHVLGQSAAIPLATLRRLVGLLPPTLPAELEGDRAVVRLGKKGEGGVVVLVRRRGHYLVEPVLTATWAELEPGPDAPPNRTLSLAEATDGVLGTGDLVAVFDIPGGGLVCRLFEARAPRTVANFVALARGLRGFIDPKSGGWAKRPFYDGLTFHAVVSGELILGGDPRGDGRGGPGYGIADELDPTLRHDRAGVLSMANRGPNTGGSQFFITLRALPELDDRNSVFGVCDPVDRVRALASGPVGQDGLLASPVPISSVRIERRPAP